MSAELTIDRFAYKRDAVDRSSDEGDLLVLAGGERALVEAVCLNQIDVYRRPEPMPEEA
jgi:hypothetical protein